MSGYTGTPAQFAQAHRDVSDTKREMDQNLSQLRNNIEATRAGWSGPAAAVFQNVMNTFDEKSRKLNDALQDIADMLQQSGVKYDARETDVHQELGKLGGGILG
jgi:WXG100 family type VII secretion target